MKKIKEKTVKELEREIASEITSDYLSRREMRRSLEQQWRLNVNYQSGNQYCEISPSGEVLEEQKYYGWQSRSVFNHIAPIIDTRLAKLSRVRPTMSVRAVSSEEGDLKTAVVSSDILKSTTLHLRILPLPVLQSSMRYDDTATQSHYTQVLPYDGSTQ